ncbi:glycine cleavage system protein R [Alteromonas sp. a30]|uniref:glycine cleavage system protein R n=1 Tax=Alteromonas sp. a30 TaxID=2730917 RepID=UPI00227E3C34|nr:ACT domain-containing protein [Alteromonas sp. a30]MCY7296031.1 glycine cleavage system protein R [Alteromonas sp. a30]
MKSFIITLVGKDKPGLLGALADTVYQFKGNWLGSNFALMAGRFAGFAEIELPEENLTPLEKALKQRDDVDITISSGDENPPPPMREAIINIVGNDKTGIVHEITAVLNKHKVNIIGFKSERASAPSSGTPLFKATANCCVTETESLDDLVDALEYLANDLMIDVDFADK